MTEATAFSTLTQTPKAKLSPALKAAQEMLRGKHLTRTTPEIYGLRFTLRTLEPFEEDEAASLVSSTQMVEAGGLVRKAYLACSITHVNDEPVENAFAIPDDLAPDIRKALKSSTAIENDWRRREILQWLNSTQSELIDTLFDFYLGMLVEKRKALGELAPLSQATTPAMTTPSISGASSPTS